MTIAPPLNFGPYTLDLAAAQLRRDGVALALRPKAFELLVALARRPGELVTKDELLDSVWGRRFISEGVIKSAISELRTALDDDPKQPRWIETVARRGYRFALPAGQRAGMPPLSSAPASGSPASSDPEGTDGRETVPTPLRAAGNVPAALASPVGRDDDIAALAALLADHRLLTVAGPSGIGKTRLALALAGAQRAAWTDGAWVVELAPLATETTDAATLCASLAQALRLDAGAARNPENLARALQPLALLLVLDNAEHLLEVLAPLVATLLSQAPRLRVVVTSQEPLRIPGEQVFRLAPLSVPAAADDDNATRLMDSSAVRLFVERVADRMPGFALAPRQQRAVADICRALDGLPLALELAAARVPVLGVHGIAELLLGDGDRDDGRARLQLLTQGARTAVARQRSLRDALAWSHGLLDDRQQRVFRRLGVFRGGFSLDAAQLVCADDTLDAWGVLDVVHALVEKSLLSALPEAGAGAGADGALPRFTLQQSLRAFALERLAEAGEAEATADRHLAAVRSYWEHADARALSDPTLPWTSRHRPEIDNLRAALRWAGADARRADEHLALTAAAAMVWHRAGLFAEGRAVCEVARAQAAATGDARLRRGFGLAVSILAMHASAYAPAESAAAALRIATEYEQAGDRVRAYYAYYLAYQLSVQAQSDPADLLARMAALEQPGWCELLTRYLRTAVGYEHRRAGRIEQYMAFCRKELALCRRLGAVVEGWAAAHGLMLAERDLGQVEAALATGGQALAEIRATGRLRQHASLLALWTTMLAESGDSVGARRSLAEALPILRSNGTPWMAHVALAWLAAHEGRNEEAARLVGWHDAAQRGTQRPRSGEYVAHALAGLTARLAADLGDATLAHQRSLGESLGDDAAERLALEEPMRCVQA